MYQVKPKKGRVAYCPNCHQFGKLAPRAAIEGMTRESKTPIALCVSCVPSRAVRKTKYLPGQGMLYTV